MLYDQGKACKTFLSTLFVSSFKRTVHSVRSKNKCLLFDPCDLLLFQPLFVPCLFEKDCLYGKRLFSKLLRCVVCLKEV